MARIFFCTLKNRLIKDTHYAIINLRVFHISMRSVGEPSGLDFPVARGPVPRVVHRHEVAF